MNGQQEIFSPIPEFGTGKKFPSVDLRCQLRQGRTGHVTKMAWSPDGSLLAVPTQNGEVELWNALKGDLVDTIRAVANSWATCVSWSPDGRLLAVGSGDNHTRIWSLAGKKRLKRVNGTALRLVGNLVAWPQDSELIVTASEFVCFVWSYERWRVVAELGFSEKIVDVAVSKSGYLAIATRDGGIHVTKPSGAGAIEIESYSKQPRVRTLCWSPDGRLLAAGSSHGALAVFDPGNKFGRVELEGHTRYIRAISFSADGRLLVSKCDDSTVRLWNLEENSSLTIAELSFDRKHFGTGSSKPGGTAFHPSLPVLATLGNADKGVRIWNVSLRDLSPATPTDVKITYTTAKVVLVGDSGVGKTGLGWRLSHGGFKEHASTHGQQFWVLDQLRSRDAQNRECEAVLWDLAGQADYRLTHALFLDRVDLALILFDPGNHAEPLKGVEYWLSALKLSNQNSSPKILVGARCDRAALTLSQDELSAFVKKHSIVGGFVATSALKGEGVDTLIARMKENLSFASTTTTVTTTTFKRIKEYVLKVKEDSGSDVLVDPHALKRKMESSDSSWEFSSEEMMTAIHHLANHGYVSVLRGESETPIILLTPERLSNLASSIVLEARRSLNGLGALEESRLLSGDYKFPEVTDLDDRSREVLLDAVVALFLNHNICFRERLGANTFLVFPSLINQKKPTEELGTIEDISYSVTGRIENVYPALVVLLGYSNTFTRTNQWQNQAQYEMNPGEICGFRQVAEKEGEIEFILYYSTSAPDHVRLLFQGLFETFLLPREVSVTKFPAVWCPNCSYHPDRAEAVKRIKEEKQFLFCGECGNRIMLPGAVVQSRHKIDIGAELSKESYVAHQRTLFETALAGFKGFLRDRGVLTSKPTCFISYAWGVRQHEKWVLQLSKDLQNADVEVLLDRKDNAELGSSIAEFVNTIEHVTKVVVIGTPEYLTKYQNKDPKRGTFVAAEMDLLNQRLTGSIEEKKSVIPLVLAGDKRGSLPPLLRGSVFGDFRTEQNYFSNLFDLITTIYAIAPSDTQIYDLRQTLWESE
jgi:small GTP-binding protein